MPAEPGVAAEQAGEVLHIRLHRPERANALTAGMLRQVITALEDSGPEGNGTRVVVISGTGADFCAGVDRREVTAAAADPSGRALRALNTLMARASRALGETGAVTIAQVNGQAIGAGLGLALSCDLRLGSTTARCVLPELAWHMPPAGGGGLPRLLAEIGPSRARQMLLLGTSLTAADALSLGVLHQVEPPAEIDAALEKWTRRLLRARAEDIRAAKTQFRAYAAAAALGDMTQADGDLLLGARPGHREAT